jgi:hypothetical protein
MQVSLVHQVLSIVGAVLILAGYAGHQAGWLDARKTAYNAVNAAGAALLAYVALRPFQAGFAVLESAWTVISIVALGKALRAPNSAHDAAAR